MGFPEQRLVEKAKAGDSGAFGQLVTAYQDTILYLIYDFTGNYEDARDIAQDVFVKAYQRIHQFEERSRFSTWLHRIAVNQALDFKRRHKKMKVQDLETSAALNSEPADESAFRAIEHGVEHEELKNLIQESLNQISGNQKTAVILKYFNHRSTGEIAEIMECSEATVRTHLFRAIQHLRQVLPDRVEAE